MWTIAGARVERHEVGGDDAPDDVAMVARLLRRTGRTEARTRAPRDRCRLHLALDRELAQLLGEALDEAPGHDEAAAVARLHERVVERRVNGRVHVRRQGPRGRRPDEQRHVAGRAEDVVRLADDRKRDVDARVVDGPVPLPHLAGAERRSALRPPPDDLVPLIEEALLRELSERPPDALDVRAVVGDVRVAEVGPEGDPLGQRLPLTGVSEDRLDALLDEGLDAVLLDGRLAVEAQLLLDLDLDRQPVRVPPRLARHAPAAHRLVSREEVLDDAREHVAVVRQAVGRGRALVEDERPVRRRLGQRLLEDLAAPSRSAGSRSLPSGSRARRRLSRRSARPWAETLSIDDARPERSESAADAGAGSSAASCRGRVYSAAAMSFFASSFRTTSA